jgi:hypothetical protein
VINDSGVPVTAKPVFNKMITKYAEYMGINLYEDPAITKLVILWPCEVTGREVLDDIVLDEIQKREYERRQRQWQAKRLTMGETATRNQSKTNMESIETENSESAGRNHGNTDSNNTQKAPGVLVVDEVDEEEPPPPPKPYIVKYTVRLLGFTDEATGSTRDSLMLSSVEHGSMMPYLAISKRSIEPSILSKVPNSVHDDDKKDIQKSYEKVSPDDLRLQASLPYDSNISFTGSDRD